MKKYKFEMICLAAIPSIWALLILGIIGVFGFNVNILIGYYVGLALIFLGWFTFKDKFKE